MGKIGIFFKRIGRNFAAMFQRFPLTTAVLVMIVIVVSMIIEEVSFATNMELMRFVFCGIFAFFLTVAVQFMKERFQLPQKWLIILFPVQVALAVVYYFFMTSVTMRVALAIELFIICFALLGIYLVTPSYKSKLNFDHSILSHVKAFFTSAIYSGILFLGLLAIYYAIDLLLVDLEEEIIGHIANIVFVLFAPSYYLSLLPKFSQFAEEGKLDEDSVTYYHYPKFLDILVSYILIPLISAYTLVLVIYFLKVLFTFDWPIGEIGPMVLIYSAAGLIIYLLCHELKNKFSTLFRKLFPFFHIPLVILQLISVVIRLNAYGFTESRYYVTIFGIYSIICSVYLILSKKKKASMIVMLSAIFALLSIIPPIDAFSISKNSQINRVEEILVANDMLVDDELIPNSEISSHDKYEIVSITFYLSEMGHMQSVEWIPEESRGDDFYRDFRKLFGFEPYGEIDKDSSYVEFWINMTEAVDISGYDTMLRFDTGLIDNYWDQIDIDIDETTLYLINSIDENDHYIIDIENETEQLITIDLNPYLMDIASTYNQEDTYELSIDQVSFVKENDSIRVKIIFENAFYQIGDHENIEEGNVLILMLIDMK